MTASIEAARPAGVLALRREIYANPAVSRADLTKLLEISRAAGDDASPEFADLLAEVAADLMVRQVDPPKYIAREDAAWLIAHLGRSGGLNRAELKMLAEMLCYAVSAPPGLVAFVVREIEKKIVSGQSVKVTRDDLELLRIAVFAGTEGCSLHVSRDSAEALFRIAQAAAGADNDPGFDDFFAKAVGNYLMGIAFRWTPSAEQERRKEKWLEEKPSGIDGFLSAMLRLDPSGDSIEGIDILASVGDREEARLRLANEADAREMAIASAIDPAETDWLLAHLAREGALTSAEKRLLSFLKQEAPSLPPSLLAIMERQAA
jgi:hypothetical protein